MNRCLAKKYRLEKHRCSDFQAVHPSAIAALTNPFGYESFEGMKEFALTAISYVLGNIFYLLMSGTNPILEPLGERVFLC